MNNYALIDKSGKTEPPMTALEFLRELHRVCHFQTREGGKVGKASGRELERWFANRAIILDGKPASKDTPVAFPITSLVLFPRHPVTLWQS